MITLKYTHIPRGTPVDDRSAGRRESTCKTHNIHKRQISMSPLEFEPAIPASERPQNYALDRAATEID